MKFIKPLLALAMSLILASTAFSESPEIYHFTDLEPDGILDDWDGDGIPDALPGDLLIETELCPHPVYTPIGILVVWLPCPDDDGPGDDGPSGDGPEEPNYIDVNGDGYFHPIFETYFGDDPPEYD
ncbi:MAG: hypothetical protein AAF497_25845 [Planctomycetota bacterium]